MRRHPSLPGRPVLAALALLLPLAACTGSPAATPTLTLVDAGSGHPVEGALVFAPGDLRVFRSDARGRVSLPPEYGEDGLRIHARHHRPVERSSAEGGDSLGLELDSTKVVPAERARVFSRADTLRGTYGPYRANNDLLTYDLAVVVDPEARTIRGTNRVRFRMLEDGDRIQLDLYRHLVIDSVTMDGRSLDVTRDENAFFVDFPEILRSGDTHAVVVTYHGQPQQAGRFGGLAFRQDSLGNPWITTANQGIGASVWWPNKDQQPDEVDSMTLSVTVPSDLVDASNGRLVAVEDLGDGRTRYDWKIQNPINNYSVSLNIGKYEHFSDTLGELSLDFYAQPYHLEAARRQFAQARPMLECYQSRFGPYPFPEDGYKLIEVPYSGMEHQSAVTYGNHFANGYLERDWTGVGISPRFDFIIIHESGHEWFGNSVTARDVSDAWIHEGFDTYAEAVYVECQWGYEDAITYVNGYKEKVDNEEPIIGPPGVNHWPTQDMYFKGALFLNTLRHVVDDDEAWWDLLRAYTDHFRHADIWTTDVITFFNEYLERDLRPVFEQYLWHPELPVLEVRFEADSVRYRWRAAVDDFDMPVKVRAGSAMRTLHPTTEWQSAPLDGVEPESWQPATDLFYIEVERG